MKQTRIHIFSNYSILAFLFWLGTALNTQAQTHTVQECFTPTSPISVDGTGLTGDFIGSVNFTAGSNVPVNHIITNMEIEIVWSATKGSCSSPTAGPVDLSRIGFMINPPTGLPQRWFAASAGLVGAGIGSVPTFAGNTQILGDTVTFTNNASNNTFNTLPISGNDFLQPNGQSLTSNPGVDYLHASPDGNWNLFAIFDDPTVADVICIERFCITMHTMDTTVNVNCQNVTAYLNIAGTTTVAATDLDNGSANATQLSVNTLGNSSMVFTCADVGANQVILIGEDVYGNTDNCPATVTIVDTISPIVTCQSYTAQINNSGNVNVFPSDIDAGSFDNCGPVTLLINGQPSYSFTCADLGTQMVTLTAIDASGNADSCTSTVTIEDNINPTVVCQNIDVYLHNPTSSIVIHPFLIDAGSSDNCSIVSYLINNQAQDTFDCNDIGVQMATLTVIDASGNSSSCNANINIIDSIVPITICQNYDAYLDATGNVSVLPASIDAGSSDNCSVATLQINGSSSANYTNADLGTQNAVLSVIDGSGNVDNCVAQINVLGSGLVTTISVQTQSGATSVLSGNTLQMLATITPLNAAIQDVAWSVSDAAIASIDPLTGVLTAVSNGSVVVTATATDGSGITGTMVITVGTAGGAINALCQNITVNLDATGNVIVYAADIDNGSTANAGIAQLLVNGQDSVIYNCTNLGTNPITLTVVDNNGGTDLCNAIVTVNDNIDPIALCNTSYDAYLDPTGEVTILAADIDNGSTDNCGIDSLQIAGASSITFTTADVGVQPVLLDVFDISGNSNACAAIVNVIDTNALICSAVDTVDPVAICQNVSVAIDLTGIATVLATDIDNGSYDNCGIQSIEINSGASVSFNCSDLGINPVSLTVIDTAGNSNNCISQVTIYDPQSPSLVCNANANVYLDASGTASVNPSDLSTATDACGIASWTIDGVTTKNFSCNDLLAPQLVQIQVVDLGGNSSNCQSLLTILDTASVCNLQGVVDSIHAIPCDTSACIGAIELSALGGTAPYTFLWNDADTGANRTGLCSGYYSVTITDDNGTTATIDSILVPYTQGCVWPGDTDDNTVANNFDLLSIALAFGDIGSVRPNATTNWEGQSSPDWNISLPGLPDHKHIDTDGDGAVGISDVNAILLNYGQSYFRSSSSSSHANATPLWPRDMQAYEGERIGVPIHLGSVSNPATDVYGIAFTLSYDPALVNANTIDIDFDNSWLGTDLLTLEKNFDAQGSIDVALARKDRQNISGYGQIATAFITIHDEVLRSRASNEVDMPMVISNIRLIDADNNEIPINSLIGTLTITADTSTSSVILEEETPKVVVYPNPAKDQLFLQAEQTEIRNVSLYNTLGQLLTSVQQPSSSLVNLDVSAYEAGVYLLQIETDKGLVTERIIIK